MLNFMIVYFHFLSVLLLFQTFFFYTYYITHNAVFTLVIYLFMKLQKLRNILDLSFPAIFILFGWSKVPFQIEGGRCLNTASVSLMHSRVFAEKQPQVSDPQVGVGTEVLREVVDCMRPGVWPRKPWNIETLRWDVMAVTWTSVLAAFLLYDRGFTWTLCLAPGIEPLNS